MTADTTTPTKPDGPSTVLHKMALGCAALTVFFACVALFIGSHLAALQADYLHSKKQAANSEAAAIQQMRSDLTTVRQALDAEKKQNEHLRQQAAAAMKDLKTVKADLAKAHAMITSLQSTPTGQPMPSSGESAPSAAAGGVQQVPSTGVMPQLAPKPVDGTQPAGTLQSPAPAANAAQPVATTPPPAAESSTASGGSSVAEETITEKSD